MFFVGFDLKFVFVFLSAHWVTERSQSNMHCALRETGPGFKTSMNNLNVDR